MRLPGLKYILAFTLCIQCHIFTASAQGKLVKGCVYGIEKQGDAPCVLSGVLVTLRSGDDILEYAISGSDGSYVLPVVSCDTTCTIVFQLLGYKEHLFKVSELELDVNQLSYKLDCILYQEVEVLNTVVVRPDNVEPDTIDFNLDQYNILENDNLSKILEQSPNFSIDKEGSITYKGKSINKILVNGDDFFTYQNSIALDNIEKRMLKGIEIINNYKDRFELDNNSSETVLNLLASYDLKSIFAGGVEGGYGVDNKFDVGLSMMSFAKKNNGFLVGDVNNVGVPTIGAKDLYGFFDDVRQMSYIQASVLNDILRSENRKKDLSSSTDFQYKHQGKKDRLDVFLSYMYRNRENEINHTLTDNASGLSSSTEEYSKSNRHAVLGKFGYDHMFGKSQKLSYELRSIVLFPHSTYDINSDSYVSKVLSSAKSYSLGNSLIYANRFSEKLFLDVSVDILNEKSVQNSYMTETLDISQGIDYILNDCMLDLDICYDVLPYMSIGSSVSVRNIDERLDSSLDSLIVRRSIFFSDINAFIRGNKILGKFSYNLNVGYALHDFINLSPVKHSIPIDLYFEYEDRLNRTGISLKKKEDVSSISNMFTKIEGNQVFIGNDEYSNLEDSFQLGCYYSFNSFIKGTSFNTSFTYYNSDNGLQPMFKGAKEGVYIYDVLKLGHTNRYLLNINTSFLLFKSTIYPVKVSFKSSSSAQNSVLTQGENIRLRNYDINAGIYIKSTSRFPLNFETSFAYEYTQSFIADVSYPYQYYKVGCSLLYESNKFEASLSYSYDYDIALGNTYHSSSIGLSLLYKLSKRFHVYLVGENVDRFVSLFDNSSYSTRVHNNNGVIRTTVYTQAIPYLILKMKFNF